jgi:hypothetical protein
MNEKMLVILWCLGCGCICLCGGLFTLADFKDEYRPRYSNNWGEFGMGAFAIILGLIVVGIGIAGLGGWI